MTTIEENEQLTRVGPGTLMGTLMREYWIPAALSSEFPGPDSDPVRIRLLCEDLIGFRTTSGQMGLIQNGCPHRGASLFFGRNEEEGIRCVYHGWKFDAFGHCVDMPSEPVATQALNMVKFRSYPCVERGGVVWTYMGSRETPPPLPDLEPNMMAENVQANGQECNWLQSVENNLDTLHAGFLHYGAVSGDDLTHPMMARHMAGEAKDPQYRAQITYRAATYQVHETESGGSCACERPQPDDENSIYWRLQNWHFPFYTQSATNSMDKGAQFVAIVPVDDTYTISYMMRAGYVRDNAKPADIQELLDLGMTEDQARFFDRDRNLPNSTDWRGRFRPRSPIGEDIHIDREVQRFEKGTPRGFTGITSGVNAQDIGITESQGPIQDRSEENLRTSDRMIHLVRTRLLTAAKALRDEGVTPPGVDNPRAYRIRAGHVTLPKGTDVWEATKAHREAFAAVTVDDLNLEAVSASLYQG